MDAVKSRGGGVEAVKGTISSTCVPQGLCVSLCVDVQPVPKSLSYLLVYTGCKLSVCGLFCRLTSHTHTERQSPPSTGFPIDYFDVWNVQAWNYRTSAALYSFFSALARTEANGISSFLSFFSDARFCVPSYIILSIWQNNFRFLKSFHLFVSKKHKRGRTVVPHSGGIFAVFSEPRFVRQPAVCSHLPLYKDWEQLFVNMLISERADMQICYLHTERAFLTLTLCCWSIIRKANKHISKCHSGRRLCSFLCRRTVVVTGGVLRRWPWVTAKKSFKTSTESPQTTPALSSVSSVHSHLQYVPRNVTFFFLFYFQ